MAVQLPNLPQTMIAFYAALSVGAIVVMTNPLYTLREVKHQWADADVKVAITADFVWDQVLKDHQAELNPKQFVIASIPDYFSWPIRFWPRSSSGAKVPRATPKCARGPLCTVTRTC